MIFLKFYFVQNAKEKLPVKAIRKENAFVNPSVPHLFGLPVRKEKDWERRPDKALWNGLKPRTFKMLTYPEIDTNAWFTYKKVGDKVKRITLAEFLRKGKG
jgi:hypothetical protein